MLARRSLASVGEIAFPPGLRAGSLQPHMTFLVSNPIQSQQADLFMGSRGG